MPYRPEKKKRPWRDDYKPFQSVREDHSFYNSRKWRKTSTAYREKNPFCVKCQEEGRITQAEVTDHIVRIKDGGEPYDERNLQALCKSCHNRKSGKEAHGYKEKGGRGSKHPR
ncbi:HNH endonuclease [Flagellimonas sp.]|uniref:HNH endonuclease n=1 Tax=Flagellimonas sp. TaxID=2058762 RepID=UPI003B51C950